MKNDRHHHQSHDELVEVQEERQVGLVVMFEAEQTEERWADLAKSRAERLKLAVV